MSLAPCPLCGTQTAPGTACSNCGTPTPAPVPTAGAQPAAPAAPTMQSSQWQVILEKLRRVAAPKYNVRAILGYGGMAGVYLADEPRLGRNVAIKVMAPGLMMDPQLVERFGQEARTIAQLNHPNIVTIYEVDEREDLHWFTMTFVAGRTLARVLSEAVEALPISVVRAWLYQIGDALAYAHQHGIVHRDIKPGNVLLDLRGNALVTDFGIAKVADHEAGLTRTGMLVGTPAYMSPEQCSSGRITGSSDQYSLGAVAYQMLTGEPPFAGATLTVLQAHLTQPVRPIQELRPDCPNDLADAVMQMLEKSAEDRFPSISDALSAAGAGAPGLNDTVRDQMTALAAQAAAITVSFWSDAVSEGIREQIRVLIVDGTGRILDGRKVETRSSHPQVATMSDTGVLSAFSPGSTQLTLMCGSAVATLPLVVEPDPVRAVEVHPAAVGVAANSTKPLNVIVHDFDGTRLDDRAVLWTSSDPAVARVDSEGVVEGVKPGLVTITAVTGGQSAICTVTVTEALTGPGIPSRKASRTTKPTVSTSPGPATPTRTTRPPTHPTTAPRTLQPEPVAPAPPSRRGLFAAIGGIAVIAVVAVVMLMNGGTDDPPGPSDPGTTQDPDAGAGTGGTQTPPPVSVIDTPDAKPPSAAPPVSQNPPAGSPRPVPQPQPQPQQQQQQAPPVTPTPPPQPARGTLEIGASVPTAAVITARDETGVTYPVIGRSRSLEPGTYTVTFRAPNYEDDQRVIVIRAGERETWTPEMRPKPVTPPTGGTPAQPPPISEADQRAIEQAVDGFVQAFANRNADVVVPLLPAQLKVYDQILRDRSNNRNFTARRESFEAAQGRGDSATAPFSINVSWRAAEQINQTLRFVGTFQRASGGWRLVSLNWIR